MGGGAGPLEDAARTVGLMRESSALSEACVSSGGGVDTLRLDANQAWTMDEALRFCSALASASAASPATSGCGGGGGDGGVGGGSGVIKQAQLEGIDLGLVEYIEEPLRNPRSLGSFWERSGGVVPYALDESLGMGREVFTDNVRVTVFFCFVVRCQSRTGGRSGVLCFHLCYEITAICVRPIN